MTDVIRVDKMHLLEMWDDCHNAFIFYMWNNLRYFCHTLEQFVWYYILYSKKYIFSIVSIWLFSQAGAQMAFIHLLIKKGEHKIYDWIMSYHINHVDNHMFMQDNSINIHLYTTSFSFFCSINVENILRVI